MKKIFFGVFVLILLGGLYGLKNPIHFKENPYIVEYKSTFDITDPISFVFCGSKGDVQVRGSVNPYKVGKYKLEYKLKDKNVPLTIFVQDTTPPKVQTKNIKTDRIEKISPDDFIESIEDASKTKVKILNPENLNKKGHQIIKLEVEDTYHNKIVKKVRLTRKEDQSPPSVQALPTIHIKQGITPDFKKDLKIEDDFDPHCQVTIDDSKLDLTKPGTYSVLYKVKDRSQNEIIVERRVLVEKNPEYGKKIVYLSFDDGPSEHTKQILKILKQKKVKATFFVTGNHPEYNSSIKKAAMEGHTIGLHTYTHAYDKVYASKEAYFKDLQKISDMVESITGKKSKVLRFPGGSSNLVSASFTPGIMSELTKDVERKGYQYYDWNVDSTDASGNQVPVDVLVENSISKNNIVHLLMHDTKEKDTTLQALEKIIDYYQKEGYTFYPISEDTLPMHHQIQN